MLSVDLLKDQLLAKERRQRELMWILRVNQNCFVDNTKCYQLSLPQKYETRVRRWPTTCSWQWRNKRQIASRLLRRNRCLVKKTRLCCILKAPRSRTSRIINSSVVVNAHILRHITSLSDFGIPPLSRRPTGRLY